MPLALGRLYNLDAVPASALDSLAAQFDLMGLQGWSLATTDAERKALLREAIMLHRRRGTPWSIKRALALVGWPGLELAEGLGDMPFDGGITYNGAETFSSTSRWAEFRAHQPLPDREVSTAELTMVRATIEAWKPLRCHLESIQFQVVIQTHVQLASGYYDGSFRYNGWVHAGGDVVEGLAEIGFGQGAPIFRKPFLSKDESQQGRVTIAWDLDTSECNNVGIDTLALFTASGQEVVRITRQPIHKSADLSLTGSWTLLLQPEVA